MIPPFKSPSGGLLSSNKTAFNKLLAKPRVKSEHCIGILKGRFLFLRCIRLKLGNKKDMERIIVYVRGRRYYSFKTMFMSVQDQVQRMKDSTRELGRMQAARQEKATEANNALKEYLLLMQANNKACCKRKKCSQNVPIEEALEANKKASWLTQFNKRIFIMQNILGDKYVIGVTQVCGKYFRMIMDY